MGVVLDTSVLVRTERQPGADSFGPFADRGEVFIAALTVSELLVGVHRADTEDRRSRRLAFVEGVLARTKVLDFTTATARIHAGLLAELQRHGTPIGAHDLLIAATAIAAGCAVVTTHPAEFERVTGLEVLTLQ